MMSNKAIIEIDADAGTVRVILPDENLFATTDYQEPTTKAELVAMILAKQSEELMMIPLQELMGRYLILTR